MLCNHREYKRRRDMKDLKKLFKILKDKRIEKAYSFRQLENILNGRDQKISYSRIFLFLVLTIINK